MSITVVTVRDDDGAPATREVYAAGARYTTTDGNLEVLSAEPRVLGLYPSGNWTSAYTDDTLAVVSGAPGGRIGIASEQGSVDLAADAPSGPGPRARTGDPSDREANVHGEPDSVPERDGGTVPDPVRPQWGEATAPVVRSRSMRTVTFRPITGKATRVKQDDGPDRSHIRPVVFRARTYRAARTRPERPLSTDATEDPSAG